jgi:hypothetical protein
MENVFSPDQGNALGHQVKENFGSAEGAKSVVRISFRAFMANHQWQPGG